jgi:AbrB family looped-hinge helix DNA binding protein
MKTSFQAKILRGGQVTIPKDIRSDYDLKEGMVVELHYLRVVRGTHLLIQEEFECL